MHPHIFVALSPDRLGLNEAVTFVPAITLDLSLEFAKHAARLVDVEPATAMPPAIPLTAHHVAEYIFQCHFHEVRNSALALAFALVLALALGLGRGRGKG